MAFDTRLLTGVGVLAAVTEAGNFARAAEMLGLTPSAVSRAVARLEARVGVRLFDRNPREVSLTEEGRRFHTQVMPLLAGLDEAAAEAAGAAAVTRRFSSVILRLAFLFHGSFTEAERSSRSRSQAA
jgi:DNA-binding transcriptional LysR family regulator